MEQAMIPTMQAAAVQPGLRRLLGLGAGQQLQGDAFAMLFQQLLLGEGELLQEGMLPQMGQSTREDGSELGSQMAAELLWLSPGGQLQQMMPSAQLQAVETAAQQPLDGMWSRLMGQPFVNGTVSAVGEQPGDTAPAGGKQPAEGFYTVLSSRWGEQPQQVAGLSFQEGALREAKQLLARQEEQPADPPDVESLQADVDAKRFFPNNILLDRQQAVLPDANEIAAQLKDGIQEHLMQGKREFVVRLKPEGIGEIVVKLSEDKSQISLSIFTSSTQTAQMITNEVASLQNALRPLHAEVQQITVTPDGHAAEYAAQGSMDNPGQFSGQQSSGGPGQQMAAPRRQEEGVFEAAIQQTVEQDGLDIYI